VINLPGYAHFRIVVLLMSVALFLSFSVQAENKLVQKYPDVISAKVRHDSGDIFDFDVTVSSPYDTPQRYADAFRVMDRNGQVFGVRKLVHDHEDEQPFTRDLYGVTIPKGIRIVIVQARDQKYGYGGEKVEVQLPDR
jgi:hypothetical protein